MKIIRKKLGSTNPAPGIMNDFDLDSPVFQRQTIQGIMKDGSLNAHEKHFQIQSFLASTRKLTESPKDAEESSSVVGSPPEYDFSENIEETLTLDEPDEDTLLGDGDKKPAGKGKKNKKFLDVDATGRWGDLDQREVYAVVAVACLMIIGAAVALGFAFDTSNGDELLPPSSSDSAFSKDFKLDAVMQAIEKSGQSKYLSNATLMPRNTSFYDGLAANSSYPAHQRAMGWLLDDTYDKASELSVRFALASLYFNLGGEDWVDSTNWLSSSRVCDWFGALCEPVTHAFLELDLDGNNLAGKIPAEISLLGNSVRSIWLSHNSLQGTIPGKSFGELKSLSILYLEDNQLTGQVPIGITLNRVLHTIFVQHNDLEGSWPFCNLYYGPHRLAIKNFGLDCDKLACETGCCDAYTCF